jgi:predicted ATPase/DNA-binding CsgD family transcriptional regulator
MEQSAEIVELRQRERVRDVRSVARRGGPANRFVGRVEEMSELETLLAARRLVTLVGVGGVGKTRLALETAGIAGKDRALEVYDVRLADVADTAVVSTAIVSALPCPVQPGRPALEVAVEYIGDRRVLLVIDNCEQVIDAVVQAVELLIASCSGVHVLATSREPLRLAGEVVWDVAPLRLDGGPTGPGSDAVELFLERARDTSARFAPTPEEVATVAEICRELDGLPLAIELAASRVRVLGLEQIRAGLADRFTLLTGGPRGSSPRHQTLRASLDWSHRLLDDEERVLFRRLGAFAGGWTLEAAEAVCRSDDHPGDRPLLDVLAGLVDRSLVVVHNHDGEARYGMLRTVHEYAADLLEQAGEARILRDRHLSWAVGFAEDADRRMLALDPVGREAVDREAANLRSALSNALAVDPVAALRVGTALAWYWRERGQFQEGIDAIEQAMTLAPDAPALLRGRALVSLALLVIHTGEFIKTAQLCQQAIELGEATADPLTSAGGLGGQGVMIAMVDPTAGWQLCERAVALAREADKPILLADALCGLVIAATMSEDPEQLEAGIARTMAFAEPLGHRQAIAWSLHAIAVAAIADDDPERVRECARRILTLSEDVQEPGIRGAAIRELTAAALLDGTGDTVRALVLEEREKYRAAGARVSTNEMSVCAAELALAADDFEAPRELAALLVPDVAWMLTGTQRWQIRHVLARAALGRGDVGEARALANEIIEVAAALGNRRAEALATLLLGRAALNERDDAEAHELAHKALSAALERGWDAIAIDALELLGAVAASQHNPDHAARLLASAAAARAGRNLSRVPSEEDFWEAIASGVRASADPAAWSAGTELSLPDAVSYARRGRGARDRPQHGWGSLTETEMEIARLAAEGLTNVEIGRRMFVSRSTVKAHLSHIYTKLDVNGRTELAARRSSRAET